MSTALWKLCLLAQIATVGTEIPAGTEISVRLSTAVSARNSKPGDPVEAAVVDSLAPHAVVRGNVRRAVPPSASGDRAALLLEFTELEVEGHRQPIVARVTGVDNAREKVDERGQINGILASETITGKLDAGLNKLSGEYSGVASILSAVKNAVFDQASTGIDYPAGVEMTLRLDKPLPGPLPQPRIPPGLLPADRARLAELIQLQPFRTVAQNPPKPSDLTNLLLAAPEGELRLAFREAGWTVAAGLNPLSKLETLRAVAEDRGYTEAPVSVLLLDGKPPTLVFEKTNNTFARRHHLRIWRRPGEWEGKPVWAVAATHDTGIDFSEADRTFIHRIDSQIDRERDKVVNDLCFTGRVARFDLIDRPGVPRETRNATGDTVQTDGRAAFLLMN